MESLDRKLNGLRNQLKSRKVKIMIMGLGSVGNYLLNYLMSDQDESMEIIVAGRNQDKLQMDVNIAGVASMIRRQNRTRVTVDGELDLNSVTSIADCFQRHCPDIIVNSSRAYAGLKYGSISWTNVRAYGIWCPLSIRYIKNIMEAYEQVQSNAVVINTSYSDAVIPWLKSAGKAFPDFGSGNINHLLPRIKFAVARQCGIEDYWNIDVTYAVSHFHDVVISKEGQTEGVKQLIDIRYNGKKLEPDMEEVFRACSIAMPVDAKRNMMNASSNYEIIKGVLLAVKNGGKIKLHCPGVYGEIGGYPLLIDGSKDIIQTGIVEDYFSLDAMRKKNRESIYLDGIENVADGVLTYTDELIAKVDKAFGVRLMKTVSYDEIGEAADFLVKNIIEPSLNK